MDNLLIHLIQASNMVVLVGGGFALLLLAKSLIDFSQTGPRMRQEVLSHYRLYLVLSLIRLTLAALVLSTSLAIPGAIAYLMGLVIFNLPYSNLAAAMAGAVSLGTLSTLQFCRVLHNSPGVIVASLHYSPNRLYPLWELLTSERLAWATRVLMLAYAIWMVLGVTILFLHGKLLAALVVIGGHGLVWLLLELYVREVEPPPVAEAASHERPNILMIGSDTLRADRLGGAGYHRSLTPHLDRLAAEGHLLSQCYVPCARTAPSLISLMTGTWPHHHGIRDNFIADRQTRLSQAALPRLLGNAGYHTMALGDWAAADLGKFDLGFQDNDVPADQWNLKFFLRQGPKDIRLFLSLFTHNAIGKYLLEEIYYLAGVPLTRQLGLRTRQMLHRLGQGKRPFFLNVFMASTHPPFASQYPYYTRYADPTYRGPSKFAMARLTDPFEIIRRQGEPREEFDLDQILDLYDGCVKSFDDEVGKILEYLENSGLRENTLVVVYSDHGMEFFEHETWGQGNSAIGDYSARVPVIFSGASITTPRRLDEVTRSVDIAPTLLDLLHLPIPNYMDGVSLLAALRGETVPKLPAFYETGIWLTEVPGMPVGHLRYPDLPELLEIKDQHSATMSIKDAYQARIITAKDRMIRWGDWKLVHQPLQNGYLLRLYDIAHDPNCRQDVYALHPETAAILWEQLRVWMQPDQEAITLGEAAAQDTAHPARGAAHGGDEQSIQASNWLVWVRSNLLRYMRNMVDWAYVNLTERRRVLFILSDGYGFACQSPVIRELRKHKGMVVRTTTDRGQALAGIEFANDQDRQLFISLQMFKRRARLTKWHIVVDTHMNAFYPAHNALRVYMHHGPGFGILGNKLAIIKQSDIFCGLSLIERDWFERLEPGIFNDRRLFIPVGFPKNDALYNGDYDRAALLHQLGLPNRTTILITSHWQTPSTLRRLNDAPFRLLARAFPDYNVIQTGHPWLWQPNHNVPGDWQQALLESVHEIEATHTNAKFIQTSDVEALLAITDLLVGDYSSVMTTYCLLDRPIVFFNDPEFSFTIPELKQVFIDAAHTFERIECLESSCADALANPALKASGRAKMRQTFYVNEGRSAQYMANALVELGKLCGTPTAHWPSRLQHISASTAVATPP